MNAVAQNSWSMPYTLVRRAEEHGYNVLYWHLCRAERNGDITTVERLERAAAEGGLLAAQRVCIEMERVAS